jgi:lysozyme family protein
MKDNFPAALKAVLVHEGGYVNHPKDPGGATNKGVTQKTYDNSRRKWGYPTRSVRFITDAEIGVIYRIQYWDAVKGDELPSGVDYAVFDFAVNSGPARALKYLAKSKGATHHNTINNLMDIRLEFLRNLSTWPTFGKGWSARVKGVRAKALQMAYGAPIVLPVVQATAPAPIPEKPPTVAPKPSTGLLGAILSLIRAIFGKKTPS